MAGLFASFTDRLMKIVPPLRWYHLTLTAYAAWLPGDPRGFRTRNHREHVEGDYKSPPKEDYSERHQRVRESLRFDPVVFRPDVREPIAVSIAEQLDRYRLDVAAVAVAAKHVHILAKLPQRRAKYLAGRAKYRATRTLRTLGYENAVWAQGEGCKPISDCDHWSRAFGYITRHREDGAAVAVWDGPAVALPRNPWRSPNAPLHEKPYEVVTDPETGETTVLVNGKPYDEPSDAAHQKARP